MKATTRILCLFTVLIFSAPLAHAQDSMGSRSQTGFVDEAQQAQTNKKVKDYIISKTGFKDPDAVGSSGDEEKETVYRYDQNRDGTFYGVGLPQRSFNNITYPY